MADSGLSGALAHAAAVTPSGRQGGDCACQVDAGLAILPVVSTALPNSLRPSNSISFLLHPELRDGLTNLDNGLNSQDMAHHWHVMRTLPAGYLYIFDPADSTWLTYAVDTAGQLRKLPPAELPAQPTPPATCFRSSNHSAMRQIFSLDPNKTPEVWIGFSRYLWTSTVMKNYADDLDGCRSMRMSRLDVTYAASGGPLGGDSPLPNSRRMVPNIGDYVADYAPPPVSAEINKHLAEPLRARGSVSPLFVLTTLASGAGLATEMARVSAKTNTPTGIVLLLDDTVGVTAQLNFSRNRTAADAAVIAGMGDQEQARRRVVADVIEGLRASAEANPGPWWNKNYGPERYMRHIDQSAWQQTQAESGEFKALVEAAQRISNDYVAVKESARWKAIQRFDFDPDDKSSVANHEEMVAWCVAGSGLCTSEREHIWDAVLAMDDTDANNWLSRALSAQNRGVQQLMQDAPPDFGKTLDAVKNAKALAAEMLVGRDGKMGAIEVVNNLRKQVRADRAANAATSVLIETAANVMARLLESNPERYHRLLRRITIAGLVRDDLVPQPVVVRGTWERIREWIMEVMTGPVRIDPRAAVSVGPMLDGGEYMRARGHFKGGWNLSQSVNGAVLYAAPGSQAETASVVFWVVNKVETGANFDAAAMRAFGLSEIDTTIPSRVLPDNPVLRNHLNRVALRADMVLGSVALVFQAHGFYGALVKFKQGNGDVADGVKLVSSVLAASGAGMELMVAAQALRSAQATAGRIVLMKAAAHLGMWAGITDGAYTIIQGGQKFARGDKESAYWSLGSGVAAIAGSVAGFGLAATGVSAMAGGAASATVFGITMGPVGWVLLALAFLGLAVYCAIQAFGTDDDELSPVEYWLDNSVFGKRARISGDHLKNNPFVDRADAAVLPFPNVNDELYQLQRITLVAQVMFNSMRSARAGAEVSTYTIALPRYAKGTSLAVTLYGYVYGERVEVSSFQCEDGSRKETHFRERINLTGGSGRPTIQVDDSGAAYLTGQLGSAGFGVGIRNFLERLLGDGKRFVDMDAFGMELVYKPDRNQLPALETMLRFPVARR